MNALLAPLGPVIGGQVYDGSQFWHCQSSASGALHDIASRFTAGQALQRFKPGEFKFEGADRLNDWGERMGEKLARRLGMAMTANADPPSGSG
jgi:hypothetical protein